MSEFESDWISFRLEMAAIIKLSQNEWVNFFLREDGVKMAESNMADF